MRTFSQTARIALLLGLGVVRTFDQFINIRSFNDHGKVRIKLRPTNLPREFKTHYISATEQDIKEMLSTLGTNQVRGFIRSSSPHQFV